MRFLKFNNKKHFTVKESWVEICMHIIITYLNDIEDEYHCICLCPLYDHSTKKYILRKYYINQYVYKFHAIINKDELLPLTVVCMLYIKEALKSDFFNV